MAPHRSVGVPEGIYMETKVLTFHRNRSKSFHFLRNWLLDTWSCLSRLLEDDAYTCVFRNVSCVCNLLQPSSPHSPAHRLACQADGVHWKQPPQIPPPYLNGGTGQEDKGADLQSKHRKGQAELAARQAFAADRWLQASRQAEQMGRKYTFILSYCAGALHNNGASDGWMIITLTSTSG